MYVGRLFVSSVFSSFRYVVLVLFLYSCLHLVISCCLYFFIYVWFGVFRNLLFYLVSYFSSDLFVSLCIYLGRCSFVISFVLSYFLYVLLPLFLYVV